jgi:membrane-bound metal-dependent hydrolase YbcI (DUF457 family)
MPTPVGHAVAGLTTGWLAESFGHKLPQPQSTRLTIACAIAAMAPDLDLLVGSHRTYTHSIGAACAMGLVTWLLVRQRVSRPARIALTIAVAYGSHVLLDWLGKDSSMPPGLMVLWPFSSRFYISGFDLFGEVSRRYWKPDEFIRGNLIAVAKELISLAPFTLCAWLLYKKRASFPAH